MNKSFKKNPLNCTFCNDDFVTYDGFTFSKRS